jgi:hypothetical protein
MFTKIVVLDTGLDKKNNLKTPRNYSSSWFLASWGNANFVRFPELAEHVWHSEFSHDYFSWNQLKHYIRHYRDVRQKKKAGFHVSAVE